MVVVVVDVIVRSSIRIRGSIVASTLLLLLRVVVVGSCCWLLA